MNKAVERQINKIYQAIFKKIYTKQRMTALSNNDKASIKEAILNLDKSEQFQKFAKKFSKKLSQKGLAKEKGLWRKYYEAAKANNYVAIPDTYTKFQEQMLKKTIEHNFKMIKSIPQKVLELSKTDYTKQLISQVAKGSIGRGSFYKNLKEHGAKNAKVIARTETAKLQTAITENRSKDLGSVAYIWIATRDRRTRPSHKAMNDVVVFWRKNNEKPLLDGMRGNAGEFPNCRCDAQAIFDESDLTKSQYTVYDYRNNRKITMNKKTLIERIRQGHL